MTNYSERAAMSVSEFAEWAGIGRTTAWKEIREGNVVAVKVCTRTIIRKADADKWLESRPQIKISTPGSGSVPPISEI